MAKKADQTFRINGHVIDGATRQGIAGLRVEAWDKDLITNDLVRSSVTDQQGAFQIEFTSSYFAELFMDQQPDLFFKVFRGEEVIKSTEGSTRRNVRAGETEIVIEIDTGRELKARRALQPSGENEPASLGDLLATLPLEEVLSDEQGFAFAKLWVEYGDTDTLWKQAELSGLSGVVPALKRTLALSELTGGYVALVRALQTKSDAEQPGSVEFLTQLEPADWIELVFEHGVPAGSGLDRDEYVEQLQANVENKFPMLMLSKQLERKLSDSASFPTRKVLDFLKTNPDFDLRTQDVEPYLNETDSRDEVLVDGLRTIQRMNVLGASWQETAALLEAGFGSAAQIVDMGSAAFGLKVAGLISLERAGEIFAVAQKVVTSTRSRG